MKILTGLLLVNMILSIMPSAFAYEGLVLSEPTYTITKDGSEVVISTPEPGFVTTSVKVTNPGESDANACLVVAVSDKTTGKLLAVDVDSQSVPGKGDITLSKGINLASSQTYNYYVWDSIENHKPLTNTPPTSIKNFVCSPKTNSVDLSWDDSLDDKGIKNYVVMLDGKEVAKPKTSSYSVLGLDMNSSHEFEVFAYDKEGLTSSSTSASATTYGIEELILADYTNESGTLSFTENHTGETMDNYTEPLEYYEGRPCFASKKLESKGYTSFFYLPVNSAYIPTSMTNVGIEVTYFDDNLGAFSARYDCAEGDTKTKSFDDRTNTGTWKTAHIVLDDAGFASSLSGASFRIESPAGTKIYKIAVAPGDQYAPDSPNVKFGEGLTDTYDMAFYPADAKAAYGMFYDIVDGTYCMYAPDGRNFEFNIADEYATRTGGYIEVTYYDNSNDTLVLDYPTEKEEITSVDFTNTEEWKTVQLPLDAATFDNTIAGANGKKFDFTLCTKEGSPLAISGIKYVAGDSDYVPVPITEISSAMNEAGTEFEGKLGLSSTFKYDDNSSGYDSCVLYSGTAGREPLDGKHYMYNKEHKDPDPSKGWRQWKNAFYITVPKSFLNGVNYGSVEITVELYTSTGALTLEYSDGSGSNKTVKNSGIPKNTWTTTTFTMDNSRNMGFNTGFSGNSSFRFNAEGEEVKIHKITIKKND